MIRARMILPRLDAREAPATWWQGPDPRMVPRGILGRLAWYWCRATGGLCPFGTTCCDPGGCLCCCIHDPCAGPDRFHMCSPHPGACFETDDLCYWCGSPVFPAPCPGRTLTQTGEQQG